MAKARKTDPVTSHEAAEKVRNVSETQKFILRVLVRPRTDAQMIEAYRKYKTAPWAEESGLRSRRHELVVAGKVVVAGETKSRSGRRTYLWKAVV